MFMQNRAYEATLTVNSARVARAAPSAPVTSGTRPRLRRILRTVRIAPTAVQSLQVVAPQTGVTPGFVSMYTSAGTKGYNTDCKIVHPTSRAWRPHASGVRPIGVRFPEQSNVRAAISVASQTSEGASPFVSGNTGRSISATQQQRSDFCSWPAKPQLCSPRAGSS